MARPRRPIELVDTLEKVKFPSAIVDRSGIVTWENEAARKTFGDLLAKPFTTIVASEDASLVQRQLERKLHGVPVTDYEVDVFTTDGRRQRAEISSVTIPGGDQCHAVFGIARTGPSRTRSPARLTPRQMQVLRLLGEGASTAEIADMLHLSKETVRNHVRHVLRALGVHSRLEAVALAHQHGLLRHE